MTEMTSQRLLRCESCAHEQPYVLWAQPVCQACGGDWLEPIYDYAAFRRAVLRGLPGRSHDLWRYAEVLPVAPAPEQLASVGGTPLHHARRYGATWQHQHIYIKDERYGPTSSFKDRQACLAVAAMLEAGITECVIASTGNAGVAYAAACARAGIKLWVFMTSQVPAEKLREAALFGAEVIRVTGNYDETKQLAMRFAARRELLYDRGAWSVPAREAMKTIAYEIVEQLGWRAPDWYIQSVSGGLGPLGVYHGFRELEAMGLIDRIPKLGIIQADGCAPMVQAFKAGKDIAAPVEPTTSIAILSTGNPGKSYTHLWQLVQRYGGTMESVSDQAAWSAMRTLAAREGMAVEPATAVAFAGLEAMLEQGQIGADELVVVNGTGHTFPVEKHVLGDQWRVDLDLGEHEPPAQQVLDELDERTTTVLLIDDNLDDALLLRRLLSTHKDYRVLHANDGHDGLIQARQRLPDLVVLDLTMPRLDGFAVLEALRADPRTRLVPVVVVSAKDISAAEKRQLDGRIEAIYQKGSLPTRDFVSQVVQVLRSKQTRGSKA